MRLAILVIVPQGSLAGDLGAYGPVVAVGVQRTDGLTCLPRAAVPAHGMMPKFSACIAHMAQPSLCSRDAAIGEGLHLQPCPQA